MLGRLREVRALKRRRRLACGGARVEVPIVAALHDDDVGVLA